MPPNLISCKHICYTFPQCYSSGNPILSRTKAAKENGYLANNSTHIQNHSATTNAITVPKIGCQPMPASNTSRAANNATDTSTLLTCG